MPALNNLQWYALWTRSRHEKHVRDQLSGQGIEPLLPLVRSLRQWKDRKKEVHFPLFPGYCFARFAWKDHLKVLKANGVVRVIGGSGQPTSIPEQEIFSLKKLSETTLRFGPYPYLVEGKPVRIIRGPLEGVEGILSRKKNRDRLVILIHLIQQAAAVEIDTANVEPL